MKTSWTKLEKSQGELLVTLQGEEWKSAQEKAFKKIAKKVEIPGFRKGSAPESLIRRQINPESVKFEAVQDVATDALFAGIEEHKLEMIAQPSLDIKEMTDDEVTLVFVVTVRPDVKLAEYKNLTIKKKEVEVKEKDVNARLKTMQERFAELVVKKGMVAKGDTAVIDFEGFKDGVAFEGGKGDNYPLEIGSNAFIPGFEDQLVGLKAGEEKDVEVTFPEDYQAEDLAGKPVVFKVKVNEVKKKKLPKLDDDFAKEVDIEGVETLDQLKEHVTKELTDEKTQEVENAALDELMSKVVDKAEVEIPEVLVTDELDQMVNEFKSRLSQQGLTMELYSQFTGQDEAAVRDQMKVDAEKRVKMRLVLAEIAKAENLEVSEEELEAEYTSMSEMYGMKVADIKKAISEDSVKYDLLNRKAFDLVKTAIK